MASPFEFSYVFTVIGKIWEAMPVTLLLTFAPLFIGFLFGVPFAVIRRFNVPFAASFLKNASNILKGIPAVLLVLMINYLILKPIDYLALSYEWAKPLQTMNKIYRYCCVKHLCSGADHRNSSWRSPFRGKRTV